MIRTRRGIAEEGVGVSCRIDLPTLVGSSVNLGDSGTLHDAT